GITYLFYDGSPFSAGHHGDTTLQPVSSIDAHAVKVTFVGSNPSPDVSGDHKFDWYENYYLGNDPSKWAPKLYSYREVNYADLYNGIGLTFYQYGGNVKYDFIVSPAGNPADIKLNYRGYDQM